ncbi:MAG: DUF4340 domain-containing protein [Candidatus Cloacimonetes bacterium]|nr:DUF4340 domain-containing protein [Candidatus Cloacimonadota bacterium]
MNKRNLTYLTILVVLIVIYAFIKNNDRTERKVSFFGVDSVNIGSIEIFNDKDTLRLVKENDEWALSYPISFPANQSKVRDLFAKALRVQTSSIPVSELESSFPTYNVTDSLGTKVILTDHKGQVLVSAIIGKSSNYNFSHGRKINDNKVYQLNDNISYVISPTSSIWRRKEIIELAEEDITAIRVAGNKGNYQITPSDSLWVFQNADTTFHIGQENAAFRQILNTCNKMMASSFEDGQYEKYAESFNHPVLNVSIELYTGEQVVLDFIQQDDKKYLVRRNNEEGTLFLVYENLLNNFQKDYSEFTK